MGLELFTIITSPLGHLGLPVLKESQHLRIGGIISDMNVWNGRVYEYLSAVINKIRNTIDCLRLHFLGGTRSV